MTAQLKKTAQTRLHRCVLAPPKGPKIRKKLRHHARVAIKASDFVADTIARVENAPENVQVRRKAVLLGKYPIKIIISAIPSQPIGRYLLIPLRNFVLVKILRGSCCWPS